MAKSPKKRPGSKPKSPKPPNRKLVPGVSQIEDRQFIEIVNWKKAQPNMPVCGNDWMKLYTSLLEHDGFAGLDDSARMTIIALWLYAARSGLHILPADPRWLRRKIPMLNSDPDIQPLLEAADAFGNPTPFLAYCQPPGDADTGSPKDEQQGKKAVEKRKKSDGTAVATRTRGAQRDRKRVESREERREKREDETLSGFEREKKKEKKERVNSSARKKRGRKEKTEQEAEEPEKPENPKDSEVGSAKARHIVPKPARSAFRRGSPQCIGSVIGERFPEHWQDPDCEAFGWEIVRALGLPVDPHNVTVRSEWGAFARFWWRVKKVANVMLHEEIRRVAVKKALFVASEKAKSARNRRAVWTHIMYGELAHRGVNLPPPARASPAKRAK